MIRINLLKPLEFQPKLMMADESAGRKKKLLLALAAVVVVGGAMALLQYPSLLGGMLSDSGAELAAEAEPQPAPPVPRPEAAVQAQPKQVTDQAVEEIVREIHEEQGQKPPAPTYAELVPSEKIEFQYFACSRILKDIKAITPPEVGFADFIFTPPGDFYVRGLARNEQNYQSFKSGLSGLAGVTVRTGLAAQAGKGGAAKEFSFYGTVKYPLDAMEVPPDRVVSKVRLQQELRRLKDVAGGLGIRLKLPQLSSASQSGQYQKLVYKTVADCNYQQMQDFLSQLHDSKSNLGFLKFSLHARGDEQVVANLDILAYVD